MSFPQRYEHVISQIVAMCPAPDKFAHVFAGMTIWLLTALVTRRPLGSRLALCTVILAEVGNEIIDFYAHGSWEWRDTLGDAAATWFWPVVLFLALNNVRSLSARTR